MIRRREKKARGGGKPNEKLRAVGYCRTSGEGQRDNTSIPGQKRDIVEFIRHNHWQFIKHYVDESLSGAKVEGREDYQRMLKDAANGLFDIVVIFDVSRFGRDGAEILGAAKFLKKNFGIHVIDTKGFDTRKPRNSLINFVKAGVAEDERLSILERTARGRIAKAREGKPWAPHRPFGRDYDAVKDKWYVTEKGKSFRKLLIEYADGKSLNELAPKYGWKYKTDIPRIVHESRLSGTYVVHFNSPDLDIDLEVPVPVIPEVISPKLEKRVLERMAHNKKCNKQHKAKYPLTGFVKCARCGYSLTAGTDKRGTVYYQHSAYHDYSNCSYRSIRGDVLESHVLDYLYNFYTDEPSLKQAIRNALPSDGERKSVEKDIKSAEQRLSKVEKQINNLANAIAEGADASLLVNKQNELRAEKESAEQHLYDLRQTLVAMPDPKALERNANIITACLGVEIVTRDWRDLSYEDVRRFLHFLFTDNPRKNKHGIFVDKKGDDWLIDFKGVFNFPTTLMTNRTKAKEFSEAINRINAETRTMFEENKAKADRKYRKARKRLKKARNSFSIPKGDCK